MHQEDRTTATALTAMGVAIAATLVLTNAGVGALIAFFALVVAGAFLSLAIQRSIYRRTEGSHPLPAPRAELPHGPGETTSVDSLPTAGMVSPSQTPGVDTTSSTAIAPLDLEPISILDSLAWACGEDAVSASLWLEDPSTGALRQVAAVGPLAPPATIPESGALSGGHASLEPLAGAYTGARPMWRLAIPLPVDTSRGMALVDIASPDEPPLGLLLDRIAPLRAPMSATLALRLARERSQAARELVDAACKLSRCTDPVMVLERGLDQAVALTDAATASIAVVEEGSLHTVASRGFTDSSADVEVTAGEGIASWVMAADRPLLLEDIPSPSPNGDHSIVSAPIVDDDGVLGVITIGSAGSPARFTNDHVEIVDALARQIGAAYRNATEASATKDMHLATLRTLAAAMALNGSPAKGKDRVPDLALRLGRSLELDSEGMTALELAAVFHDVGMSAVGYVAGGEDRPLTTVERGLLKMHPVIAAEMLAETPALEHVSPIVHHHHERYDGTGYVEGLQGEAIPLEARILSVVDAFVAMTSTRPYRKTLTRDEAIAELEDNAGSQFDPGVVERFVEILRQGDVHSA